MTLNTELTKLQIYPFVNNETNRTPKIYTGIVFDSVKPKRKNKNPIKVTIPKMIVVISKSCLVGIIDCDIVFLTL